MKNREKEKQYFISLGAGYHQTPLIKAARDLGYRVIGVDQDMHAQGLEFCDIRIEESILNYRKISYKLELAMMDGDIAGGFSASYGEAVLSWSYLADKLKLIGLPRTLSEHMLDKYWVRDNLTLMKHEKFGQPNFLEIAGKIKRSAVDSVGYPVVIKMREGHGKRNIAEKKDFESVKKYFSPTNLKHRKLSGTSMLIEEKIFGDEITVTGFVQDFKYTLIAITDKVVSDKPPFIEIEHKYPSVHSDLSEKIHDIHQEAVEVLNLPNTPIVSEWKLHRGKLYLVEMSAQIPGEYLASYLIPAAMNYDYYNNLIKLCTGESVKYPPSLSRTKSGSVKFVLDKMSDEKWATYSSEYPFSRKLNENPHHPARGNHDRFAVVGMVR